MINDEFPQTQYGVKLERTGRIEWPDDDGDLRIPADGATYISVSAPLAGLRDRVKAHNEQFPADRLALVSRTLTASDVETITDPLPTVPGSLIRAIFDGEPHFAALTDDSDSIPWRVLDLRPSSVTDIYVSADRFSSVEVLFDASTAPHETENIL